MATKQSKLRKDGRPRKKPGPKPKVKRHPNAPKKNRSPMQRHQDNCAVCKHEDREEIEQLYLYGESPYELADKYKLEYWTIHRHAKAYKLDDKRDFSTLTKVRKIIDRAKLGTRDPSDALVSKALELQGKVTGELIERHKLDVNATLSVAEASQRQVDNLKKKIGLTDTQEEQDAGEDGQT